MIRINATKFGSITVNGKSYGDILIISNNIVPRDKDKIRALYGTSHMLSKEETSELLRTNPEVVVIGSGQNGALRVDKDAVRLIKKSAELIVTKTPEAIKKFNELSKEKRTNALFHVTC